MTDLLLTRPRAVAMQFLQGLDVPGRVMIAPLIQTVVTGPLPDMSAARGVILTSGAGVQAYKDLNGPRGLAAQVVGTRTAQEAEDAGLHVTRVAQDADDLVRRASGPGPLWHLHGTHTRGGVAARLSERGIPTEGAVIYDQPERPLTAEALDMLARSERVIVPLFSPRTAQIFVKHCPKGAWSRIEVAAISPAVMEVLPPEAAGVVAERPNGEEMRRMVGKLLKPKGCG